MNRLKPFADGKRAPRTRGAGGHVNRRKTGPGRYAAHQHRPTGTKLARWARLLPIHIKAIAK
jgi:hypothetical protein